MGSIRELDPERVPEHRRDLLGQASPEDYKKAVLFWGAGGSITGYKRHLFDTRREAFLSGLGLGILLGAAVIMVIMLWMSA